MGIYFSTEATLTAKVKTTRLKLWGDRDRDNVLDPTTLTQAMSTAQAQILASLYDRYGSQTDDWDSDSVPELLKSVSDSLSIYYLAAGSNAVNETVRDARTEAMQTLAALAAYDITLPGVTDSGDYDMMVVSSQSIFDNNDDLQTEIEDELIA